MTLDEYNAFCASFPHSTYVVQWRGAHVWKVGGKVFAIGGQNDGQGTWVTFKVSEIAYDVLKDQPGLRPAPHMASRGLKWIQHTSDESVDDEGLRDYIRESYRMVTAKLPRAMRKQLGIPA